MVEMVQSSLDRNIKDIHQRKPQDNHSLSFVCHISMGDEIDNSILFNAQYLLRVLFVKANDIDVKTHLWIDLTAVSIYTFKRIEPGKPKKYLHKFKNHEQEKFSIK